MGTRKPLVYAGLFLFLGLAYFVMRDSTWEGSAWLHTVMETAATLLAFTVGILALVRYYSKKNNTFLFVGSGFLGTGLLDGYHAVVTSPYFFEGFPSALSSLIPWSWTASRVFLSVFLWLSWLEWRRETKLGEKGKVSEEKIYLTAAALTSASFLFFAFFPLPRAYYAEFPFHRPQEFVPALFFLLALIGYLAKGSWKQDAFEHWLVLSLIVGFMGQAMFMSFSGDLFDMMFDSAHLLKKISYIFVMIGLVISMYHLFKEAEEGHEKIARANEDLREQISARELAEKELQNHRDHLEELVEKRTAELERLNEQLEQELGRIEEAEKELERKHDLLVTLIDNMPDYIYIKDRESRFILNNRAHLDMLGCKTQSEAEGKTDFDFFARELAKGKYSDERAIIKNGNPLINLEELNVDIEGKKEWVSSTKVPMRDKDGEVVGIVGISRDITARKLAEEALERKTEELARSNEELENFAYVASHDLQEPLRTISSFAQLLAKRYKGELDQDADEFIGYAVDGAERMKGLINDLLDYSRVTTRAKPLEMTDSEMILDRVLQNLQVSIEESHANISRDPLPKVMADPAQLTRLLQNLIGNAIKFRGDSPPEIHINAEKYNGEYLFSVRDNGIGIETQYKDRIFVVFQRLHTRREYSGSGMGLAICRKIVERHGGRIWVDSEPEKGSTFYFTIPDRGGGNHP